MAKLKDLIKENFSIIGGVVSQPAIGNSNRKGLTGIVEDIYGTSEKVSAKEIKEAMNNFSQMGKLLQREENLKEIAHSLSEIATKAKSYTLSETDDWFDKVTVNRNMKELTNLSKQFGKLSEEANSVQQRLSALYEDMGNVLGRYYDLNETHDYGHESDDAETPEIETGEENPYQEPVSEADDKYAKFFRGALNKFGVSSPAELGDKKQAFYNYVDKNYQAKQETD